LALALEKSNRFDEAIAIAQRGQEAFPADAEVAIRLAELLLERDRAGEALIVAQKGLDASPNHIRLLSLAGSALLEQRRFEDAISTQEQILALEPHQSHAYFMKAVCQSRLGQSRPALETAMACIKQFPKQPDGWRALVVLHCAESPELALQALDELRRISPDDPTALNYRVGVLFRMRRLDEALASLMRLIELQPDDLGHRAHQAMILRHLGRTDEAAAEARDLMQTHADYKDGWIELCLALDAAGDKSAALDAIERAIALDPRDSFARHLQCELFVSLQRWTDTLAAVEAARTACGSSFDSWNLMASETAATVATRGAGAAMEVLAKALAATEKPDTSLVVETAEGILSTELQLRGPVATARALGELRATLARHRQQGVLADVFTGFVSKALGRPDVGSAQWAEALPMFASAVDGSADCRLPLEMLSVGTRYRREGDETILLTLPLEQRALLREALGLDKASDADDTRS
jgi:tetratricopeptide (TPR) repeat protein